MANNPVNVRPDYPQPQVAVPRLSVQVPGPCFATNVCQEETTPRPFATAFEDPSPRPVQSSLASSGQQAASGGSPKYRGVRSRSGKWVSEIREPRKSTRIWLGTYPTPEMAAAAYDVAVLALKGPDTFLNFPNSIVSYPVPASTSASDIQAAAASAAEAMARKPDTESTEEYPETRPSEKEVTTGSSGPMGEEFIDVEELLNMPKLLVDMAEGMLVSPPRIESKSSEDSGGDNLWSYV
ncbi:ethylene-responsive transcription factor ERF027-like [Juglans microcarpa x Juglans regia]|uniref:ethylene-responsive transcription factor ERF027-like n=1 Tax=Juglans microcarpa x Juglans regia TaxID=2249226 RepID=UPI001B7E8EB0|nr:ethylene-responsive transcription factor ERF027-like [Juglans microcarpa x Juglans regia]